MRRARELGHEAPRPDSRLPRWTWLTVIAGAVLAYAGVGMLLQGARFTADLENLLHEPASRDAETMAPYVLLLIPAVLGGRFTRDGLQIVFRGLRRGDPKLAVAKEVVLFVLSLLVLILVALTSSSKRSSH